MEEGENLSSSYLGNFSSMWWGLASLPQQINGNTGARSKTGTRGKHIMVRSGPDLIFHMLMIYYLFCVVSLLSKFLIS